MILAWEHLTIALRVTTVVAPVAIYFLVVGLLNSRRTPQLLTGRRDFAMMLVALSPLMLLPLLQTFGVSVGSLAACVGLMLAIHVALAPRGHNWVIYNMSIDEARTVIDRSLRRMGVSADRTLNGFKLADCGGEIRIGGFSMLRNVSIHMEGVSPAIAMSFGRELSRRLAATRVQASQMAMCMLLLATAMLVVPVTMLAHKAPDIVRLLGDIMP